MMEVASRHEETWLLLPWLANGRLAGAPRAQAEEHLRECPACAQELATQRRMCELLTEPERVTYAPGPSLRKLLDRIEGQPSPQTPRRVAPRARAARTALAAAWRPPGLAWAATFILTLGLGVLVATTYRWSQPLYGTTTNANRPAPDVLHIAFERSLPMGEVEELLRSAGARVVEGPDSTGIFGVSPTQVSAAVNAPGVVSPEMRTLTARLHADPRVRWIQPLDTQPTANGVRRAQPQEP